MGQWKEKMASLFQGFLPLFCFGLVLCVCVCVCVKFQHRRSLDDGAFTRQREIHLTLPSHNSHKRVDLDLILL